MAGPVYNNRQEQRRQQVIGRYDAWDKYPTNNDLRQLRSDYARQPMTATTARTANRRQSMGSARCHSCRAAITAAYPIQKESNHDSNRPARSPNIPLMI